MTYRQYPDAPSFLKAVGPTLERDQAANNLMLGLAEQLSDSRYVQGFIPFFGALEERGRILLAGLQTPPKRLVLYGDRELPGEAVEALVSRLLAGNPALPGVIGPSAVSRAFQDAWTARRRCGSGLFMSQRVYRLRKLRYRPQVPGRLRLGSVEDMGLISRWIADFMKHIGDRISYEEAVKRAKSRIGRRDLFVWETERVVSMVTKTRPTRNGIIVSGVFTPPAERRKGYATACVAELSRLLLESGYDFCSLFADLANPYSNRIYQKIGYEPVCDYLAYDFS